MKEEVKAGIIIVTALFLLTALVMLIGGGKFLSKADVYYVRVMNAAGIEPGSQVRLGGVRVGSVTEVKAPTEAGKPVMIQLGVDAGTPIYKGTKALVTQIGFVGDIYLHLTVENTTNERINPGSDIPAEESIGFAQIMTRLDGLSQTVDGLVRDVDKVFSPKNVKAVEDLLGETNKAIVSGSASVQKIAVSLKSSAEKLDAVLIEISDVVKNNKGEMGQLIKKAREDLDRAGEMIKAFEETARSAGKATRSIDRTVEVQSRNVSALIESMTRTTEELQEVLQEIKLKPWSVIYQEKRGE